MTRTLQDVLDRTCEACVPFVVQLELTHACNLACVHCYLPDRRPSAAELDVRRWAAVFAKLRAAGTLFLVVTGGEPLVRPDALDLLAEARAQGLAVRLLTNGTLLERRQVERLAALQLASVDVSVLGETPATHDALTGVPGSHALAMRALDLLAEASVRVFVKVPVMRVNWKDVAAIEAMAARRGFGLRYDVCIAHRLDGDEGPLRQRLSPRELVKFLGARTCGDPSAVDRLRPAPPDAAPCGAGQNAFCLAPDATVFPCLALRMPLGNALSDSWDVIRRHPDLIKLRSLRFGQLERCGTCELIGLCGRCAATALVETGRLDGPSPSACEMGELLRGLLSRGASPRRR